VNVLAYAGSGVVKHLQHASGTGSCCQQEQCSSGAAVVHVTTWNHALLMPIDMLTKHVPFAMKVNYTLVKVYAAASSLPNWSSCSVLGNAAFAAQAVSCSLAFLQAGVCSTAASQLTEESTSVNWRIHNPFIVLNLNCHCLSTGHSAALKYSDVLSPSDAAQTTVHRRLKQQISMEIVEKNLRASQELGGVEVTKWTLGSLLVTHCGVSAQARPADASTHVQLYHGVIRICRSSEGNTAGSGTCGSPTR
jgi:hypothetical protein